MRTKLLLLVVFLVVVGNLVLAGCGTKSAETQAPAAQPTATQSGGASLPVLSGEVLMNDRCTVCHNTDRIKQAQKTKDEWQQTVTRMVGKGAKLSAEEQTILIEYLAQTYGK